MLYVWENLSIRFLLSQYLVRVHVACVGQRWRVMYGHWLWWKERSGMPFLTKYCLHGLADVPHQLHILSVLVPLDTFGIALGYLGIALSATQVMVYTPSKTYLFSWVSTALPSYMGRLWVWIWDKVMELASDCRSTRLIGCLAYHPPGNPTSNWSWKRLNTHRGGWEREKKPAW